MLNITNLQESTQKMAEILAQDTEEVGEKHLTIYQILASDNLVNDLDEEELAEIGVNVVQNYDIDKNSRSEWEKRTETAMKLALQVVEAKSFPWPDASSVKFPLITIAALQYHAAASQHPTLLNVK